jgi:hypothetical protein
VVNDTFPEQMIFLRGIYDAIDLTNLSSSFLYITGNPQSSGNGGQNAKLLGTYKLFINDALVGMGPGRPGRCGPVCPVQGAEGPCYCQPEHVYDSYDVTPAILRTSHQPLIFAIQAYHFYADGRKYGRGVHNQYAPKI